MSAIGRIVLQNSVSLGGEDRPFPYLALRLRELRYHRFGANASLDARLGKRFNPTFATQPDVKQPSGGRRSIWKKL